MKTLLYAFAVGCFIFAPCHVAFSQADTTPTPPISSEASAENAGLLDEVFANDALPSPITGTGTLSITVESFRSFNERCVSALADRAEIWLGDKRLASLNANDPRVKNEGRHRFFAFDNLTLKKGYYFITVRLYNIGALYGRRKWQAKTFQIGIHPNQTTTIHKKMPFYNY